MNKTPSILLLLVFAGQLAFAQQVLVLNTGTRIQGRYDGGNAETVWFIDEHGNRHKFNISEIQTLVFNRPRATGATGASDRLVPETLPAAERGYVDTDVVPSTGWTRYAVIPAGTEIVVRTIDPIETREANPRKQFLASIESDVLDMNGNVVIPRGSPAHLIVRSVGGGEIAVDLRSVSVNGRRYIINSEDITNMTVREGPGANRRTGAFVGGGALLGTLFGAIAGGGKGAAIGALAGGVAGAGAQVLTRGPALHIPSETVLRFRLDRPVYLYE
ncbi:MAG: hypothetical protein JWP63_4880 [Candidatus Solibacter sp.]|jgi:hypothetical protein|nr:hypothetical protein [Candidatus Solibacter sp.]